MQKVTSLQNIQKCWHFSKKNKVRLWNSSGWNILLGCGASEPTLWDFWFSTPSINPRKWTGDSPKYFPPKQWRERRKLPIVSLWISLQ